MHDAGGLVSSEPEAQGFSVQWIASLRDGSPGDLVSRRLGVQGVGMVITSRRDAAHTARKLVID